MGGPLLGSITMFGGNFAPRGYANCDGALLSISQNSALFSILGTTYGGNGSTTFGLPNLQGRVPIHRGQQSAGGSSYALGQTGGTESVVLTTQQLPAHVHSFSGTGSVTAVNVKGTTQQPPEGGFLARGYDPQNAALPQIYVPSGTTGTQVNLAGVNVAGSTGVAGSSLPHPNIQPYQVVTFIIATSGIFPSRN